VELLGPAAGDQVFAQLVAGDRLALVEVGDDAVLVVVRGGGGGGGGLGRGACRLGAGPRPAGVSEAVPARDDSRDAQGPQSEPAPPPAAGARRAGVRHLFRLPAKFHDWPWGRKVPPRG